MGDYYILEDDNSIREVERGEWGRWYERADRTVGKDKFEDVVVSTVFLGLDHSYDDGGPPIVFETMILNSDLIDEEFGEYQTRCSTYEEALEMHKKALQVMKEVYIDN